MYLFLILIYGGTDPIYNTIHIRMKMKLLPLLAAIVALSSRGGLLVTGFSTPLSRPNASFRTELHHSASPRNDEPTTASSASNEQALLQRRALLSNFISAASASILVAASPAASNAASETPSVTLAEFDTILKDSAKSILRVELSGPKSETALIKLVDGTTFTISDLVESSTDPRSPLKLVARCRLYKIPVTNTGLISALSGEGGIVGESGRKKKSYMNPRVQEAQKKEAAKRERMAEDERERLEELYNMEGSEKGFLE